MDSKLQKIEDKVDKLLEQQHQTNVHLAKYNSELEFHVARTTQLEDELVPISRHVQQMRGAGKLLALMALFATIVSGFSWLWTR